MFLLGAHEVGHDLLLAEERIVIGPASSVMSTSPSIRTTPAILSCLEGAVSLWTGGPMLPALWTCAYPCRSECRRRVRSCTTRAA